jgi:hypothetical protein
MATPKHLRRATPQYDDFTIESSEAIAQRIQPTQTPNRIRTPLTLRSPINRQNMRQFEPFYWLILALGAFAVSAVSTVMQVAKIFSLAGSTLPIAAVVVIGGLVAFLIFLGELFTSEQPLLYGAFLLIDIAFTLTWSWPAFSRLSHAAGAGLWGAAIIGALVAWFCAWLPERVILGRRGA